MTVIAPAPTRSPLPGSQPTNPTPPATNPATTGHYIDVANPDLLRRIPVYAKAILDVGCATGALGHAFRQINPKTRLFGIERDPAAAQVAAGRYDHVAAIDAEHAPHVFGDTRFDCIIYGDSLEHFADPWHVLRAQAETLADDGVVLICVPNVEHWSLIARLLAGSWNYDDIGLLDRTHLRWFSLPTMQDAIRSAGLLPCDVHPRVFDGEQAEKFAAVLAPALAAVGRTKEDYLTRCVALQYVWRAVRKARPRMTIGATMLTPVGGVSDLRIIEPLDALATDPFTQAKILDHNDGRLPNTGDEKIFVLHRPVLTGDLGLRRLRQLLDGGWLIVTEFDDHPDFFPDLRGDQTYTFTGAHACQVTTPALAEVVRARNPEVAVFPNAIRALPPLRNFADPSQVTMFFGALNREADWEPFIAVINDVADAFRDRLNILVVHDQAFFDALRTPRKAFVPTCGYGRYIELLSACEIAFMPLLPTAFNRAKSDLKFIETAACGAAALASDVVYGNTIDDGRTGFIFRNPTELAVRLERLIQVPADARAVGLAGRQYVADQRMLAYQTLARQRWYSSLWSRRGELTAGLLQRVPALRASGIRP